IAAIRSRRRSRSKELPIRAVSSLPPGTALHLLAVFNIAVLCQFVADQEISLTRRLEMATNYETLLVTREKGITTIAFNRPEKRNAMSPQLHMEMYDLLTELRYDEETRVVILTGVGENFCAGQDLKQYSLELENQPARVRDELREKVRRWRGVML